MSRIEIGEDVPMTVEVIVHRDFELLAGLVMVFLRLEEMIFVRNGFTDLTAVWL